MNMIIVSGGTATLEANSTSLEAKALYQVWFDKYLQNSSFHPAG
jgi:hypothetical protein